VHTTRVEVPIRTIVRVAVALLALLVLARIWYLFVLVGVAFLVAAALAPPVERLQRRGWSLPRAVAAVVLGVTAVVAGLVALIVPEAISEGKQISADLPVYVDQAEGWLRHFPAVQERVRDAANRGSASGFPVERLVSAGTPVLGVVANAVFVLVLAVYLLLDGERVYGWISHYLSPTMQVKVRAVIPQLVQIVSGYMIGQAITSLMFGIFVFGVLTVLGVPGAIVLAVVAALLDAIPVVGVPVATVPAVLLALTVSLPVGVAVLALYAVYQAVENYLIVPRVYGNRLSVAPIAVLLGVVVGGKLLGILGVLLALPVVAAIPVFERIWRQDVVHVDGAPAGPRT
jgi:predicted PurR-regulated permease PerM